MAKVASIIGTGIISAIGRDKNECLQNLLACNSGIGHSHYLQTLYRSEYCLGEVKQSNEELRISLNIADKNAHNYTRTALLAISA